MDKKGQVLSLGILPIVALAICLVSLYVFLGYNSNISSSLNGVSDSIKTISFNENYISHISSAIISKIASEGISKERFIAEASKHDIHVAGQGNFFVLIEEGKFNLDKKDENYVLFVPGVFVSSEGEGVKIKRNFDLSMEFSSRGEFIRFINK